MPKDKHIDFDNSQAEAIDQEIALLRVNMRKILEVRGSNLDEFDKGVIRLAGLLAKRYGLTEDAEKDLLENMRNVIGGIVGGTTDYYTIPSRRQA